MKLGRDDKKYWMLIAGSELEELKKFTWSMAEGFGLDRRIEKYQGKRPIGLYRWDLDCLEAVVNLALDDTQEYPHKSVSGYDAMARLYERIQRLRAQACSVYPPFRLRSAVFEVLLLKFVYG
jgi:hypothetical protein